MIKIAPFKSKAQRRKFYAMKAEGKMDQKTIDEWEEETPKDIPEKLAGSYEKNIRKTQRYIFGPGMAVSGYREDRRKNDNSKKPKRKHRKKTTKAKRRRSKS